MFKKNTSTKQSHSNKPSKKIIQEVNWDDVIREEAQFFALSGRSGRFAYMALLAFWGMIINGILSLDILPLLHLGVLVACISIIFITQRRCRDFHCKGTFFILVSSLGEITHTWFLYIRAHDLSTSISLDIPAIKWVSTLGACVYLFLLLFPGKKDRTFTSTSPLLKHPIVYFGIWFILYLGGFYCLFGKII